MPTGTESPGFGLKLTAKEFSAVCDLARKEFGLELRDGKQELVSARLGKAIRRGGFHSVSDYLKHVAADRTGESLMALIDALATNHTAFLRERAHFDFLTQQVLPQLASRARVDIWSAACSTGEEPYTLACVASEAWGPQAAQRVRILATDISTKALEAARRGVYPDERLAEVPRTWRERYFVQGTLGGQPAWRVRPQIASMVEFGRINLTRQAEASRRYPIIFCRNVMIYFSAETQRGVVSRLVNALEPGGYLFVGHAESLSGVSQGLKYVIAAVYQREGGPR